MKVGDKSIMVLADYVREKTQENAHDSTITGQ